MKRAVLTGKGRRWHQSGHPWVYADDVASIDADPGDLLPVHDPADKLLGWALHSKGSRIALRFVSRAEAQPDRDFWRERVRRAIDARGELGLFAPKGACRVIGGDADGVPGFVADRYGDVLVLQCTTQGADRMRDFLLELVLELVPVPIAAVLDRSDSSVRRLEGLEARVEWLRGSAPETLVVEEDGAGQGLSYEVDVVHGHKTGHYLDQRENRVAAAAGAEGERVLDVFCYDGLFGIRAALAGAAEVLCLDQSAAAGERVLRNAERNGVADRVRFEKVDALPDLRRRAQEVEGGAPPFDRVVVDPPAFARNRKEVQGAARGYRELNLRAMKLLRSGGRLVSCSCSYNVGREAFLDHLAEAARDAGKDVFVESYAGAAADHPWLLTLPESAYLKCAFARVCAP